MLQRCPKLNKDHSLTNENIAEDSFSAAIVATMGETGQGSGQPSLGVAMASKHTPGSGHSRASSYVEHEDDIPDETESETETLQCRSRPRAPSISKAFIPGASEARCLPETPGSVGGSRATLTQSIHLAGIATPLHVMPRPEVPKLPLGGIMHRNPDIHKLAAIPSCPLQFPNHPPSRNPSTPSSSSSHGSTNLSAMPGGGAKPKKSLFGVT